jgi:hypothetical protein
MLKGETLSAMETILVDIIQRHPEYHPIFEKTEHFDDLKEEKFQEDSNPFLHLGLHVTIIEQVNINRPLGIRPIYQALLKKHQDKNVVEHKMMNCLIEEIYGTLKQNKPFNDKRYIEKLRALK